MSKGCCVIYTFTSIYSFTCLCLKGLYKEITIQMVSTYEPQHNFSINPYKTNQCYQSPNSAVGSAPVLLPSDVRSESQVRGSFLMHTIFFFCVLESFQWFLPFVVLESYINIYLNPQQKNQFSENTFFFVIILK